MFEYSFYQNKIQHLVYVRAESRTLRYLFMFERSRELFVMQAESRTLRYFTPCLCSSRVENLALLYSLFTFERSREPFCYLTPCLCSNLYNSMFTFERSREPFSSGRRSREPCPTCLRSSGVENLV